MGPPTRGAGGECFAPYLLFCAAAQPKALKLVSEPPGEAPESQKSWILENLENCIFQFSTAVFGDNFHI